MNSKNKPSVHGYNFLCMRIIYDLIGTIISSNNKTSLYMLIKLHNWISHLHLAHKTGT